MTTNSGEDDGTAKLREVAAEFALWRRAKGGPGVPLPQWLWCRATEAAKVAGVPRTVRALRVNRQRLEARLGGTEEARTQSVDLATTFVAVTPATSFGTASLSRARFECADGRSLEVDFAEDQAGMVLGLAEAFWRGPR